MASTTHRLDNELIIYIVPGVVIVLALWAATVLAR